MKYDEYDYNNDFKYNKVNLSNRKSAIVWNHQSTKHKPKVTKELMLKYFYFHNSIYNVYTIEVDFPYTLRKNCVDK